MKLSIATIAAVTIFSLAEGKLQATKQEADVLADTQRRGLSWCPSWAWWCDRYDDEFTQNCKALSNTGGVVHTGYDLTDEIVFSYPCSAGYMTNFAANENLLHDVRAAIGDCANICNINNAGYSFGEWNLHETHGSIAELPNGDVWCGKNDLNGTLNDPDISVGFNSDDPCICDPANDYYAGCKRCYASINYEILQCGDGSAFD